MEKRNEDAIYIEYLRLLKKHLATKEQHNFDLNINKMREMVNAYRQKGNSESLNNTKNNIRLDFNHNKEH